MYIRKIKIPKKKEAKLNVENGVKKKRKRSVITLGLKLQIINMNEEGQSSTKIARQLDFPVSTISTILKDKVRILKCTQDPESLKESTISKVRYVQFKFF